MRGDAASTASKQDCDTVRYWWPSMGHASRQKSPRLLLAVLRGSIAVSLVKAASPPRISLALVFFVLVTLALPDSAEAAAYDEVMKLTASDAQDFDQLGYSVGISDDTAVAGAYQEDAGGSNAGAAGATRAVRTTGAR